MLKMYCSESCADFDVTQDMHAYEVRPRSDKRGVDLISLRCHSVGCGTASQMQSATQPVTPDGSGSVWSIEEMIALLRK
ncbi:MAG: hypothetical protein DMF09_11125 [Verrucomicrobia bacterium]|nr:MAG: hypothetical protein DMF09_11125 [Verrucomicrobiota bacterium]